MNTVRHVLLALLMLLLAACGGERATSPGFPAGCEPGASLPGAAVPRCMYERGLIDAPTRAEADSIIASALAYADTLRATGTADAVFRSGELARAVLHVSQLYSRADLFDSSRFNRMVDHVAVTEEYERGTIARDPSNGRYYPSRTPYLTWVYYSGLGIYFNPVNTIQRMTFNFPAAYVKTDSLRLMADAMTRYAIDHGSDGRRLPIWEFAFDWNSGGVTTPAPWKSAMAQGNMLMVYTELWRRTGEPHWKSLAYDTYESFITPWDDGGVWVADTSRGYWWDEYHPQVRIFNGSTVATLNLGFFAETMNDADALRRYARGLDAIRANLSTYDTGSWTLYSWTQGFASRYYHAWHVELVDTLFARTGDPVFEATANRWRAYTPPSGVNLTAPGLTSPASALFVPEPPSR